MFAIIEVEKKNFEKNPILARFSLSNEPTKRDDNDVVAVIETGSGEVVFLDKKLKEKDRFFFFPFLDNFGSCLFFKPENHEKAEGGFERGCENINSTNVVPKKTRLGVLVEGEKIVELILLEGRERRNLLN